MRSLEKSAISGMDALVAEVYAADNPVLITDKGSECVISMRPSAFEDLLFGTVALNKIERQSLHF